MAREGPVIRVGGAQVAKSNDIYLFTTISIPKTFCKTSSKVHFETHRPKTGTLDGDPEIEREALANLETSDVFRAVTAPPGLVEADRGS